MTADNLLVRLDRVRRTGPGRWIARCPAHDDKSPSLSIRELDDGRVLVHDFGGCTVEDVVSAVGLMLADLMPERVGDHAPRERKPFVASDVLTCVAHEALIVAILAADLHTQRSVTDADYKRLQVASARLSAAAELAGAA